MQINSYKAFSASPSTQTPKIKSIQFKVRAVVDQSKAQDSQVNPSHNSNGNGNGVPEVNAPLEVQRLDIMSDTKSIWDQVADAAQIKQFMKDCSGPPRIMTPYLSPDQQKAAKLPVMIYLPGIDGTGLAGYRQFPPLSKRFDLKALIIPRDSRSSFPELIDIVREYLEYEASQQVSPGRPVYLLGESFGGILALAVAAECPELVDRVLVVNPATSFPDSIWPVVTPLLSVVEDTVYNDVLPYSLMPIFTNMEKFLTRLIPEGAGLQETSQILIRDLPRLLSQLGSLTEILPRETLLWRLNLLREGNEYLEPRWKQVRQRVLAILGDQDLMLPSAEEGPFLQASLIRCTVRVLQDHGHALMMEKGVDLYSIMEEEGFYTPTRRLSTKGKQSVGRVRAIFGETGPVELPTDIELRRDMDTQPYGFLRWLQSPCFFSTTEDGEVIQGLSAIPTEGPLLFIGNHQTIALDLGILIPEVFLQTGRFLRGLTHPAALLAVKSQKPEDMDDVAKKIQQRRAKKPSSNSFDIGRLFESYGSVRVSAKNMIKLLQQGEAVLLFPGGAREATKLADQAYQLYWPDRQEFVRIAAKCGATIIPFGAIGTEDNQRTVISAQQLRQVPFLRQRIDDALGQMPQARMGVNALPATEDGMPQDVPTLPLNLPVGPPERMLFKFQKPIKLSPEDAKDREKCAEIYKEVKSEVRGAMDYLIEKRADDPYRDVLKRLFYEATWGRTKQAPTFKP